METATGIRRALVLLTALLLGACGGGGGGGDSSGTTPPPQGATFRATGGVAEKGPLIRGSTVTAQELDAALSPTGRQFSYQVTTDLGTFEPTSTFNSQYIGVNATGYYFDEVLGAVSSGTVTLNSYNDLSTNGQLNVNILTTLAYQRIRHLVVNSNLSFAAARTQAENEVLAALNIPAGNYGMFSTFDLAGDSDGDHLLAAISSLFVDGNQAGALSALMSAFQSDIATDGQLSDVTTRMALAQAAQRLNASTVAANLTQQYASLGVSLTAADISNWLDQDGDGLVGKAEFEVHTADPSSVFTLPSEIVAPLVGKTITADGGQLSVNGSPVSSATVQANDAVALSPATSGPFPSGVLRVYLLADNQRVARVSFISGVISLSIDPSAPGAAVSLKRQLTATGHLSDGGTVNLSNSVQWTSSPSSIATITPTGLVETHAPGSATITATLGRLFTTATFTVTSAVVESLVLTPDPLRTGVGLTVRPKVTGHFSDGTTDDVTSLVTWNSSAPGVATVDLTGLVTGVSLGTTNISATIGSVTGSTALSVITGLWTPTQSMATLRGQVTATMMPNGKVLVTGSQNGAGSGSTATEIFDPVTQTWSPGASLASGRFGAAAVLLGDGRVLVAGGGDSVNSVSNSAEVYDPVTDTWSSAGTFSDARKFPTMNLLSNGKVLIVGGQSNSGVLASAALYDPATNTWSAADSLATARAWHTATVLQDGRVLIVGGASGTSQSDSPIATAELYDPATDSWSAAASIPQARGSHTATRLLDGRVLVAGGRDITDPWALTSLNVEIYDPVSDTWTATGGTLALTEHTATLRSDGRVLLTGGRWTPNNVYSFQSLVYDPGTNGISAHGNLANGNRLYAHTAVLLPNDVVLLIGGHYVNLQPQPWAQWYW
ncbi:Ig-like domain-containing protein [Steroidobacter sp. S1-65]|uniref:Ig-like domain-containing protein n=1 Tax=Steroidobacter gossypii TaxID=2805490 RepID=A0ABS1X2A9_9GAMM|nr:kelch repeat-containing protein [Steroidobacter gossypii]MBM0107378.1 Ig-like domain-containing protein [Steroidobacter gossypii]